MSPEDEATALSMEDISTSEPFDPKLFEEIEAAEETESNRLRSAQSLIALHSPFTTSEPIILEIPPVVPIFSSSTTEEALTSSTSAITATSLDSTTMKSSPSSSTQTTLAAATTADPAIEIMSLNETDVTEVSQRLFKKYSPSKEVELRDDDLRFLNSHVQLLQHDFIDEDMDPEETCRQANPCENGGTCMVKEKKVHCECVAGFIGEHCEEVDRCLNHACANNSTCKNGPGGIYICECKENTVGTYCQFICAEDQCSGNGTCIMREDGKVGCKCNVGMTGVHCEKEIDECRLNKCQNAVECIDKFDDYECVCERGWIGKDCDRPCQDVYGSCRTWKREGQCEIPRESTDFFEVNCPVSCEKCVPSNDTSSEQRVDRLPAVLLPLSWIIGVWQTEIKGFNGRAFDFPLDFNSSGYNETITFTVAKPVLFGTPSINFTCEAVNKDDPTDLHIQNGFLTIRQYPPVGEQSMKVALTTVSNQGANIIEEGPLTKTERTSGPILNLTPIYFNIRKDLQHIISKRVSRSFVKKGNRLIQTITKEVKGRKIKFKKLYNRIREFEFF
ncbi:hypothetical protein RB195_020397 [Necator americanus]|uniref:EGF-like domain protein n=1 Tax=Necator americanus TaxID=51031 RepID=A0ABR1CKT7_NECAM